MKEPDIEEIQKEIICYLLWKFGIIKKRWPCLRTDSYRLLRRYGKMLISDRTKAEIAYAILEDIYAYTRWLLEQTSLTIKITDLIKDKKQLAKLKRKISILTGGK